VLLSLPPASWRFLTPGGWIRLRASAAAALPWSRPAWTTPTPRR